MKNILGGTLEVIKEETVKTVKTAVSQVTGKQNAPGQSQKQAKKPQSHQPPPSESVQSKPSTPDETKSFVKDLYGQDKPQITQEEVAKKELEDRQKKEALRQRLHSEYYQTLTSPPKPKEERPAEKVEREKKQEMTELEQKKAEKPPPLVQRTRERVEKFPGASG